MNDESPKEIEQRERIAELAAKARIKIENEIRKSRKLIDNLNGDLEKHGDADRWKRCGDLLLANSNNATRKGDLILVTDYFDENAPLLAIEGESNLSSARSPNPIFAATQKPETENVLLPSGSPPPK
ncbi:MAG: NFACT family protein [Acidobacteria bacterium]|nr:NFACT family protein [Acidobacteriota bacterium]